MRSREQTKRKHDEARYEQPQRRAARNPMRELNNGVESGIPWNPSSATKRPLIAAAGTRASRSYPRAPRHDRDGERKNKPGVCREALLGRHVALRHFNPQFSTDVDPASNAKPSGETSEYQRGPRCLAPAAYTRDMPPESHRSEDFEYASDDGPSGHETARPAICSFETKGASGLEI